MVRMLAFEAIEPGSMFAGDIFSVVSFVFVIIFLN